MTVAGDSPAVATPVAQLRDASRRFGPTLAVENVNLSIGSSEFVALLGRSGSGKSTLLRMLAGLDKPTQGVVEAPRERMVVFQEPRLLPWKTAIQNVALGLSGKDAVEHARSALAEVGLEHRLHAFPATLSGGEAQRTALARALVRNPRLLLLDEPFAALDALTRMRMHRLVESLWAKHQLAVLLITHDVDEAILLADRAQVIDQGRLVASIDVPLSRPRDLGQVGFLRLRQQLLAALGVHEQTAMDRETVEITTGRVTSAAVAAL